MGERRLLRTAVIGYGLSGRVFHAPFLEASGDYSLDAIVTSSPERAAQAAASHPAARIVATAEELFAGPELLDLVVVGTPPGSHYALAEAAISHGLHVVVDKPFVPVSAQGEALIAKARQAGVVLSVYQNRRWDADFLTLTKLVRSGELGRVHTFESRFERWKPEGLRAWKATADPASGGGILFDLGVHLIDQALTLFGPVATVYGETSRHTVPARLGARPAVGPAAGSGSAESAPESAAESGAASGAGGAGAGVGLGADEDAFVSLLHESGVRSRLWMNLVSAQPAPRFRVLGSAAAFISWGMDGQEAALNAGAVPGSGGYGVEPEERWGTLGTPGNIHKVPSERGRYPEFYRQLAAAINHGAPVPVRPADALDAIRIIEQIHRQNRSQNSGS
ncbi:oxidoreductase [Arthrobacter sp. CAU 1506]|uniref:Gfo/Idh/MocA family protein n=1 Tax=Arthrobacter sp. CAU 1506 TaxID=2560052 RepID=UPI0010ABF77A|nr:Gfo/Idh/MocA family oxidoreductase [Arthrobacter sp. CAU 1506]TJY69100.1 oxidoreductase [Arthrobacter sp. CAU 1506]